MDRGPEEGKSVLQQCQIGGIGWFPTYLPDLVRVMSILKWKQIHPTNLRLICTHERARTHTPHEPQVSKVEIFLKDKAQRKSTIVFAKKSCRGSILSPDA